MNNFNFAKTCIGSVPHTDAEEIVKKIIEDFREIPFWPQLPKRTFQENMYAQYAEGLPGIVIDGKSKRIFVDTARELSLDTEKVFQKYLDNDLEFFSIKQNYAEGLYGILGQKNELKSNSSLKFIKGHITGPVSFGLTLKDTTGKSIIYIKEFEELIPKFLGMKARWQVKKLKTLHDKVIIFIDEPYLVSIGSSYISIDKDKALNSINEITTLIKQEGALTGLHCCGNTEWDFLLNSGIDILSFDAYNFMKEFLLYRDAIKKFIEEEKSIAWGVVPTAPEELKKTDSKSLANKMAESIEQLKTKGIEPQEILKSSIITPSCGCGTLTIDECDRIFNLLDELSKELQ